jgi:hypothetical protein
VSKAGEVEEEGADLSFYAVNTTHVGHGVLLYVDSRTEGTTSYQCHEDTVQVHCIAAAVHQLPRYWTRS